MLVACFGGFISCVYVVILLFGHCVFLQQFFEAVQFASGVFHLYAYLFDACVAYTQVVLSGGDSYRGGFPSCGGIGKVCFCLGHPEAKFSVFDDEERVAFAYLLILFETYLLDKSRYAGVDRSDMLLYLCIVGILDVSQMDESGTNINGSANKE